MQHGWGEGNGGRGEGKFSGKFAPRIPVLSTGRSAGVPPAAAPRPPGRYEILTLMAEWSCCGPEGRAPAHVLQRTAKVGDGNFPSVFHPWLKPFILHAS